MCCLKHLLTIPELLKVTSPILGHGLPRLVLRPRCKHADLSEEDRKHDYKNRKDKEAEMESSKETMQIL